MLIWELECLFALLYTGAIPIKIGFIAMCIILLELGMVKSWKKGIFLGVGRKNLDWIQMISAKLTNFKWCGLHCRYFGNTPVYKCFNVDLGTWMSICAITYRSSSNKDWIYRYTNNIIRLRMVKSSRKGIFLGDGRNTKQIWIEFRRKALSYLQKREDGEKRKG